MITDGQKDLLAKTPAWTHGLTAKLVRKLFKELGQDLGPKQHLTAKRYVVRGLVLVVIRQRKLYFIDITSLDNEVRLNVPRAKEA